MVFPYVTVRSPFCVVPVVQALSSDPACTHGLVHVGHNRFIARVRVLYEISWHSAWCECVCDTFSTCSETCRHRMSLPSIFKTSHAMQNFCFRTRSHFKKLQRYLVSAAVASKEEIDCCNFASSKITTKCSPTRPKKVHERT